MFVVIQIFNREAPEILTELLSFTLYFKNGDVLCGI